MPFGQHFPDYSPLHIYSLPRSSTPTTWASRAKIMSSALQIRTLFLKSGMSGWSVTKKKKKSHPRVLETFRTNTALLRSFSFVWLLSSVWSILKYWVFLFTRTQLFTATFFSLAAGTSSSRPSLLGSFPTHNVHRGAGPEHILFAFPFYLRTLFSSVALRVFLQFISLIFDRLL